MNEIQAQLYPMRAGINEIYLGNRLFICTRTCPVEEIQISSHVFWFESRSVKGYRFCYIDRKGRLNDNFCSDYGVGTESTGGNALFKHEFNAIVYNSSRM